MYAIQYTNADHVCAQKFPHRLNRKAETAEYLWEKIIRYPDRWIKPKVLIKNGVFIEWINSILSLFPKPSKEWRQFKVSLIVSSSGRTLPEKEQNARHSRHSGYPQNPAGAGGGGLLLKQTGMLVASLRGANFGYLVSLGAFRAKRHFLLKPLRSRSGCTRRNREKINYILSIFGIF